MKVEKIDGFPAGTNVFLDDFENMGTLIGRRGYDLTKNEAGQRVIVMHKGSSRCILDWMIIADELTGERIKITF